MTPSTDQRQRLSELAQVFLKLGTIAFGGPVAHIALMEEECVRRRQWLSRDEFLDLIGATNLIPGPNSTEMAIHIGRRRAGTAGLLVAGASFIIPAVLIVGAIAWGYRAAAGLPAVVHVLYGIKPVVVAIVVRALWSLGHVLLRRVGTIGIAGLALIASRIWPLHEIAILLACGAMAWFASRVWRCVGRMGATFAASPWPAAVRAPVLTGTAAAVAAGGAAVKLSSLFFVFFKAGALLFGSGYVLLAFLRADLVERLHWLTDAQLLDAIAVGQVTPGPVFTTATFIGALLAGPRGAIIATIGIFLPAFVFVAASAPLLPVLRRSSGLRAALDGVNAASWALMASVTWDLGRNAVIDPLTTGLAAIALVLVLRRWNTTWLIAAGALAGWFLG